MTRLIWDAETRDFIDPAIFFAKHRNDKRAGFPTPQIAGDYEVYDCPITGKPIEGKAAHRENLKRNNCRLLEKGESRDAPKRYEARKTESIDRILSE